jgi:hypothetical protein
MTDFAKILGLKSTKTMYNHLRVWKSLGLIRVHGANITLVSTKTIKRSYSDNRKTQITQLANEGIKELEARLFAKLIERKLHKADVMEKVSETYSDRYEMKPAEKNKSHYNLRNRQGQRYTNLSQNKYNKVIFLLEKLNVLKPVETERELVMKNVGRDKLKHLEDFPGYRFYFNGNIYLDFGSAYEFLEHPRKEIPYNKLRQIRKHYLKTMNAEQTHKHLLKCCA